MTNKEAIQVLYSLKFEVEYVWAKEARNHDQIIERSSALSIAIYSLEKEISHESH